MATVTILLNDYISKNGTQQIVIRVEHAGRQRLIPVGHKIEAKYWTGDKVAKHPDATIINSAISSKKAVIDHYLADCQLHSKPIHLDLIGTGRQSYSFTGYLLERAAQYVKLEKHIMDQKVRRFVDELKKVGGRDVYFEDVNAEFLRKLEAQMVSENNVANTRHKKFKFLQGFYSNAIAEGKAVQPNPFFSHKIVTTPVKKNKLTEAEIKSIEDLQLTPGPVADARNMFLFAFYAKGQRFETCATLRRNQVVDGRIHFRTNKGKEYLSVKIHGRLQGILDLYPDGEFVFPFVKELPASRKEYLSVIASENTMVNRHLKVVAQLAGIKTHLTFHISRHSFANLLKGVTDNIHVIKDALGHSDYKTTEIYLKALDDRRLDGEMEKLYGV